MRMDRRTVTVLGQKLLEAPRDTHDKQSDHSRYIPAVV